MMANSQKKRSIFQNPLLSTKVKSANVKPPELLIGYFLGPFGALLASGIFTSFLNQYWTDVLFADYTTVVGYETVIKDGVETQKAIMGFAAGSPVGTFLSLLPLISTILIVAGNLFVGQLIERTKTRAGKARPWMAPLVGIAYNRLHSAVYCADGQRNGCPRAHDGAHGHCLQYLLCDSLSYV